MVDVTVSGSGVVEDANRCSVSRRLAKELGKETEDHIRVKSERSKAYFIIDEINDETSDLQVNEEGLERIKAEARDRVDVESTVPIECREKAFITGDIAETLWEREDAEVFITCPHGGDIEYNTDEMGQYLGRVARSFRTKPTLDATK